MNIFQNSFLIKIHIFCFRTFCIFFSLLKNIVCLRSVTLRVFLTPSLTTTGLILLQPVSSVNVHFKTARNLARSHFLGVNAPLGPASSEGLMSVTF